MNEEIAQELHNRAYDSYLAAIRKNYTPLHPELYSIENWKLVDSLQEALKKDSPEALYAILMEAGRTASEAATEKAEEEEEDRGQRVFIFEILERDFCELLMDEIAHFEKWCNSSGLHVKRPNTVRVSECILEQLM